MLEVIKSHLKKYPEMQPQDLVKLIYQSELGVGHLINDAELFARRLEAEFAGLKNTPAPDFTEDIGGGYVRVSLAALDTDILPLNVLTELCLKSAADAGGTTDGLKEKLRLLDGIHDFSDFCFEVSELREYIGEYERCGYPIVSHSEKYKRLYKPAYRVVMKKHLTLYLEKRKVI